MPREKKARKPSTSESDSDSGPDDKTPPPQPPPAKKKRDKVENTWDLGSKRLVKLTDFRGKWYINIREFFDAGGELRPTKKGVMLTMEQWQKFKGLVGEIDAAIERNV